MHRRQSICKDDPLEELSELYGEIKEQEIKFKKVLEVCGKLLSSLIIYLAFIIEKNKELDTDNH